MYCPVLLRPRALLAIEARRVGQLFCNGALTPLRVNRGWKEKKGKGRGARMLLETAIDTIMTGGRLCERSVRGTEREREKMLGTPVDATPAETIGEEESEIERERGIGRFEARKYIEEKWKLCSVCATIETGGRMGGVREVIIPLLSGADARSWRQRQGRE